MPDVLREKYHFNKTEAESIAKFLEPMLALEPKDRANAGGMSNSPFMADTKGMENITLNVPCLSKGDGIEGWATEVKKRL